MPTPLALTERQTEEAALLYTEHEWPTSDIAEHFGISKTAVKNALVRAGVALRPTHQAAVTLRMRQCPACLRFLPSALFSGRNSTRARLASWCIECTANPREKPWTANPAPLAQAIQGWKQ